MPKPSSSCRSQARFAGSLPRSYVGFHLGLLEPSEISVDKDLPTDVLPNQITRQPQGNQTATKTGGSLAKVKKIATFSHGGGKSCFCHSNPVCPGPSWDMAPMHSKDRVFMSKTHSSTERLLQLFCTKNHSIIGTETETNH